MTDQTSQKTAEEVFESLNYFDEIAVERAFGEITSLKDKPMVFLRALLFTEKRREGLNDKDAKQAAAEATMRELTDYFRSEDDLDAGGSLEASRDRAQQKAAFCLATGVPPSEYPHLTIGERHAFIELAKKRRR